MYSEKQLKDNNFLKEIINKSRNFIDYDEVVKAYDLSKILEHSIDKIKDFKEKNYEMYVQYKNIIYKLKWVGLPIMNEDTTVGMFKYHFTKIFDIPEFSFNELWRKLKSILLSILVFEDRDNFKKELRNSLLNNENQITRQKIITDQQEKLPTVGNWLKDYNSKVGTEVVNNLKRTQYFTFEKNFKNLNDEEKKKVKILLDLYEKLKLSSLTLEGLEEDIPVDEPGKEGMIRGGVFEPLPREIEGDSKAKELNLMLGKYPPNSLERKAIEEEIERLDR